MSHEFYVFAKGRWCAIDMVTGQCDGLRRWSFAYQRDEKVVLANKELVLRGLRALAEGKPTTVRECRVLESRKYPVYKTKKRPSYSKKNCHSHCCYHKRKKHDSDDNANCSKQGDANILKDTRNVSIQVTQSLQNEKSHNTLREITGLRFPVNNQLQIKRKRISLSDEEENDRKPSEKHHKTVHRNSEDELSQSILKQSNKAPVKPLKTCTSKSKITKDLKTLYLTKKLNKAKERKHLKPPVAKLESETSEDYSLPKKVVKKTDSKLRERNVDQETDSEASEENDVKVLSIDDDDIRVLCKYFRKHPSKVNPKRFSESDEYKKEILYQFNPLVEVQRLNLSNVINDNDADNAMSLKHFATKLGLLSISDANEKLNAQNRYKLRKKKSSDDMDTDDSHKLILDTDPEKSKSYNKLNKNKDDTKNKKCFQRIRSNHEYGSRRQKNHESSSKSEETSDTINQSSDSATESDLNSVNNMKRQSLHSKENIESYKKRYNKSDKEERSRKTNKRKRKENSDTTPSDTEKSSDEANTNENHVKSQSLRKNIKKSNANEKLFTNENVKKKLKVKEKSSDSEEFKSSTKENLRKQQVKNIKAKHTSSDTDESSDEANTNDNHVRSQSLCKNIKKSNKKLFTIHNVKKKFKTKETSSDSEQFKSSSKENLRKQQVANIKTKQTNKESCKEAASDDKMKKSSEHVIDEERDNKIITHMRERGNITSEASIVISENEEENKSDKLFKKQSESENQTKKRTPTIGKKKHESSLESKESSDDTNQSSSSDSQSALDKEISMRRQSLHSKKNIGSKVKRYNKTNKEELNLRSAKINKSKREAKKNNSSSDAEESNDIIKGHDRNQTLRRNLQKPDVDKKLSLKKNLKKKCKTDETSSDSGASNSSAKENIVKKRPSLSKQQFENIRAKEKNRDIDSDDKKEKPSDHVKEERDIKRITRKRNRDNKNSVVSIIISDDEEENDSGNSFKKSESLNEIKKKKPTVFRPRMNKVGVVREYSALEDHAIVAWINSGDDQRPRQVNGNRIWKQLELEFYNLAGQTRTWHSLRNRYLRYILPTLGTLALPLTLVSKLRAAAAQGEIKSSQKANRSLHVKHSAVASAWSRRPKQPLNDTTVGKLLKVSPNKRALRSSIKPEESSSLLSRQLTSSPTYSQVTKAFALRHRVTTSTPSIEDNANSSYQDNAKEERNTSRRKSKRAADSSGAEDGRTHKSRRLYNPSKRM